MARILKRVPMDFDYPLGKEWQGYRILSTFKTCLEKDPNGKECCGLCCSMAKQKQIPMTEWECPDLDSYFLEVRQELERLCEPPLGEGYQLWENTSLGAPKSPVFASLEELCGWCEGNATIFADCKISKEEWLAFFRGESVYFG